MKRSQYFWIFLALFTSSLEPIIAKKSFAVLSAGELLWFKYLAAALFMVLFSGGPRWLGLKIHKETFPCAILLSGTFFVAMIGLSRLSAASFITLTTTTPAFVGLLNQIRGTETLNRRFWGGFFCALVGISGSLYVSHDTPFSWDFWGIVCAFATIACSTLYRTQLDVHTSKHRSKDVSYAIFTSNALIALCFTPFVNIPKTFGQWPTGLWLGMMACFANLGFVKMISYLGSTTSSLLNLLQRPIIIVLASVSLGEPLTPMHFVFMAIVFYGVYLATTRKAHLEKSSTRNNSTDDVESMRPRVDRTELGIDGISDEIDLVGRQKSA